ncbi:hypothetical protein [Chitinophaga sp. HK235]|uniref:hypothetical protein n=1 Tax=Chitinophaga sp. HK235 TaxID=2952571 RepID=UPI001BA9F46E|nr:hypothetical protein [Chitinophaga sp. HK235]
MQPFIYKFFIVACIAGMLCILLFACNSSKETTTEVDSLAVATPKVDSTSVVPVDTMITKPDTSHR